MFRHPPPTEYMHIPLGAYEVYNTRDVDEAREKTSELFRPHLLYAVGPLDGFNAWHRHLALPGMSIDVVAYGQETKIKPGALGTMYVVQFPLQGWSKVMSGATSLLTGLGSASVISPDDPLSMVWSPDCVKVILRYDAEALMDSLPPLIDGRPSRPVQFAPYMDTHTGDPQSFWDYVWWAMRSVDRGSPLLYRDPRLLDMNQTLMNQLLMTQPNNYSDAIVRRGQRQATSQAVQDVIDRIEADPQSHVSVAELAKSVGVTSRALEQGFLRSVNKSPQKYRQEIRLREAHAELKRSAASGEFTVTQVAHRWGFDNSGRFAADYKKVYGELPSDTLRGRSK